MPLVELIFVLFAILAIATPFITLVLLGKYKKLRENLDQLAEENSKQHTSFQREVADLKRQLTGGWPGLNSVRRFWVPHPSVLRVRVLTFPPRCSPYHSPPFISSMVSILISPFSPFA